MVKFTYSVEGLTDIGRVRSINQDSYYVNPDSLVFIVADGMGGHAGGEIASRVAIEETVKYIDSANQERLIDAPTICKTLSDAVNFASSRVYERALENPALRGMGTTLTLVKIIQNAAHVAHVGDSRLYLVRAGFIYQITFDHSLVSEQVRAGIITEAEAEIHRLKNVITRSVGYQEEEDVDTTSFQLEHHDHLVLCSDGLHGKVSPKEISTYVQSMGCGAIKPLTALANERGGEDNITIVVAKTHEDGR